MSQPRELSSYPKTPGFNWKEYITEIGSGLNGHHPKLMKLLTNSDIKIILFQKIEMYEKDKTSINAIEQHKLLNSLKATQFPWMYEVSKCAMQEALRDLDKAYKNFFISLKQGQNKGTILQKSASKMQSIRLWPDTLHNL